MTHNLELRSILEKYGLDPEEIGEIFTGECGARNMVYTQLIHSSLDADRLDYMAQGFLSDRSKIWNGKSAISGTPADGS